MRKLIAIKIIDGEKTVAVLWKHSFPSLTDTQFRRQAAAVSRMLGCHRTKPVRKSVSVRVSRYAQRKL